MEQFTMPDISAHLARIRQNSPNLPVVLRPTIEEIVQSEHRIPIKRLSGAVKDSAVARGIIPRTTSIGAVRTAVDKVVDDLTTDQNSGYTISVDEQMSQRVVKYNPRY